MNNEVFTVHVLIDGNWTYHKCKKINNEWVSVYDNKIIDRTNIHWID